MKHLAALSLGAACALAGPLPIDTTLVDAEAIHGATFQSHNQKVVQNRCGIFLTCLRARQDEQFSPQQWRVGWSKDGGKTSSRCTSPPTRRPPRRSRPRAPPISTSAVPIG